MRPETVVELSVTRAGRIGNSERTSPVHVPSPHSIAAEGEELPIPESHRAELARRREEHHRSPEDVVPWEEVRRQLWAE